MQYIQDTFEREEIKYLVSQKQYLNILDALQGHMRPDIFGRTRISSVYLDSADRSLIARSLEKPLYKEKLRLRWYGDFDASNNQTYIELKKKYNGIVYKRRVNCTSKEAELFTHGVPAAKLVDKEQQQIAHEIDAFYQRHPTLEPAALISYIRTAYEPLADTGLRITFDEEVEGADLSLSHDEVPLLPAGMVIMEVKCMDAYPTWLIEALSAQRIYPRSISKYGMLFVQSKRIRAAYTNASSTICPKKELMYA